MVTAQLIRVCPATFGHKNCLVEGQYIPNIQYSDLVARFLELDIAPRKNLKPLILQVSATSRINTLCHNNSYYIGIFLGLQGFFLFFFQEIS